MKKIIFLLCIIFLFSCSTKNNTISKKKYLIRYTSFLKKEISYTDSILSFDLDKLNNCVTIKTIEGNIIFLNTNEFKQIEIEKKEEN